MNERIYELAVEAENYADSIVDQGGEFHETYTKKFAELIIKECIEQLIKEGDAWEQFSRNPPPGQETNASPALFAAYRLKEDAVYRLEEHFGVES